MDNMDNIDNIDIIDNINNNTRQLPIRTSPQKSGKRKAPEALDRPSVNVSAGNRNVNTQATIEEPGSGADILKTFPKHKAKFDSALPHTYGDVSDVNNHVQYSDSKAPRTDINAEFFAIPDTGARQRPLRRRQQRRPSREKFTTSLLPPPAYVYVRTNDPNFNIFSDGILRFGDLCFLLADALPLSDLLSLYSISVQFHQTVNQRFTTMIFNQARAICHDAAIAFPWRCYKQFTRPDPVNRIPHPKKEKAMQGIPRDVPSFKWVFFCLFRQKVAQEIMAIMAEDGVPLLPACRMAILRVWFLMDLPDNGRRISIVHDRNWYSNDILYYAMMFFIKLDMRFNEPLSRKCVQGTKNMLLSQPTLATLWKVLKGLALRTEFEVLKMWIAYRHVPRNMQEARLDLFGIPAIEVGRTQFEYWGRKLGKDPKTGQWLKPIKMLRPDELIIREMVRRGVAIGPNHWMRLFMWGYVNPETLEDYEPTRRERRLDIPYEYTDDDRVSGAAVGDDCLLDLGDEDKVISSLVCPHEETVEDIQKEQAEEQFLEAIISISAEEKVEEDEQVWRRAGKWPRTDAFKQKPSLENSDEDDWQSESDFAMEG